MDALNQLGFSGNMLYYHVHLVARKLEREHADRGEAVNIIARYWRYAGWHLPAASTPNTMAGFDAWIYYIMKRKGARDACANQPLIESAILTCISHVLAVGHRCCWTIWQKTR
jgi:hypothetical protein